MQNTGALPLTDDVVLIGGGHTHALVLRKWAMSPVAGARLTVINPGPDAPYSGMLPGHVAGHYARAELDIDLVRLARFAGARLILGAADGLDLRARTVSVPGRPPIAFDLLSIDVGITSRMPDLPGFGDFGVPAKPLGRFSEAWRAYLDRATGGGALVIGAGIAGVELAMAMAWRLRKEGHAGGVTLVDSAQALASTGPRARARILSAMADLGIALIEGVTIEAVEDGRIRLGDGRRLEGGFIVGAAGAHPHAWLEGTGLVTEDGYLSVGSTLQTSDPDVFAVGDCAYLSHDPRPKAGVFAVRAAPVLLDNLRARLRGRELRPFHPQRDYLKLVSLGRRAALAERSGFVLSGALMWRWKDRIDRKFMNRFRDFPLPAPPALPAMRTSGLHGALGDKPLCGGCGAKLSAGVLSAGLGPHPGTQRDDVTALPGDDAALLATGGAKQVISTEHLRAVVADPDLKARIAAHHALGALSAMAARPQAATATIILPRQTSGMAGRSLGEIMATAREVLREAGADVVGGHSSFGDELTIGFTLTGLCDASPVTLSGGRPGDALILTKPIGSGVLMAAEMQMRASGADIAAAWERMCEPQGVAAGILADAHAMTDVTGFGLIGHLLNICAASGLGAEIDPLAVPLLRGARACAEAGLHATLFPENRARAPYLPRGPITELLFDPQTAGGLLAAVAPESAGTRVAQLRGRGYTAAHIGFLRSGASEVTLTRSETP